MNACVVGGGVVGALTAHALAGKGFDVQVLDAGKPGAATPASAGILFSIFGRARESVWTNLARCGYAAYLKLCAGIEPETGFEQRGLLLVGMEARQAVHWARTRGVVGETLSPGECRRRFPHLAVLGHDVVFLPEVAQIDPRRFMQALRSRLQGKGVHWEVDQVLEILQDRGQVRGVRSGTREWQAERVVIAAGAWSTELLGNSEQEPAVRPRRGQIVAWRSVKTAGLPVVLEGHRYLVARENGEVLAGATDEDVGFDAGITVQARTELTDFARRWYPDLLAAEPDAQWAGLRPKGDASGPRVGAHGRIQGLFFNTGHYRHGIVCAPGAAAQLAECCLGGHGENSVLR